MPKTVHVHKYRKSMTPTLNNAYSKRHRNFEKLRRMWSYTQSTPLKLCTILYIHDIANRIRALEIASKVAKGSLNRPTLISSSAIINERFKDIEKFCLMNTSQKSVYNLQPPLLIRQVFSKIKIMTMLSVRPKSAKSQKSQN